MTLALSKLAIETRAAAIPAEAYTAAKKAVLDALGCAMAGYNAPGVPAVVDLTNQWGGREEATIWFHGGKVPGPAATFANSVQVHALDLDDVHMPSITHITSVIVPTALAMGEFNDASGKETLAAVILGIELLSYKRYACCGASHMAIEAARRLAEQHDLKPADIETIRIFGVGVNSGQLQYSWNGPYEKPLSGDQACDITIEPWRKVIPDRPGVCKSIMIPSAPFWQSDPVIGFPITLGSTEEPRR